jgi:arginine-tRNA-protein transferase
MSRQQPRDLPDGLLFYATQARTCSYLDTEQATSVIADPAATLTPSIYNQLAAAGFRRSGNDIYRPACLHCSACIPLRIPTDFSRNRNQRRAWTSNQNLTCKILPATFNAEHFDLFRDYLQSRHPDGGMTDTDQEQYLEFLTSYWSNTRFIEFRENNKLLAVAVTDYLDSALSAVYTFFDPEQRQRSLGTYAILYQLELVKQLNLNWLYLGYWIEACPSMRYKADFHPCEGFKDGRWQIIDNTA